MTNLDISSRFVGRRVHRRAHLWRIARRDGVVFRFCEWDRDVDFGGETYTPTDGLDGTATQSEQGFGARNAELHGILSDAAITEKDLWAGLFRGASIVHYEIDARYPYLGWIEKDVYEIVRTFFSEGQWGAEIEGLGARLKQRRGLTAGRGCTRKWGSALCGYDIPGSGLVQTYTITSVNSKAEFKVQLAGVSSGPEYRNGTVEFLTGENAGVIADVSDSYIITTSPFTGGWILEVPTPFVIAAGDQIKITPGCARTWDRCLFWHGTGAAGAARRYGGFRDIPGTDDTVQAR